MEDTSDLDFDKKMKRAFYTALFWDAISMPFDLLNKENGDRNYFNKDEKEKAFYVKDGSDFMGNAYINLYGNNKGLNSSYNIELKFLRAELNLCYERDLTLLLKFSTGRTENWDFNFGFGGSSNFKNFLLSYDINCVYKPFVAKLSSKVEIKDESKKEIELKVGLLNKNINYGVGCRVVRIEKNDVQPFVYCGYVF